MEPERWQKIERLCYSALNQEKSVRAAFLAQACGGDDALLKAEHPTAKSVRTFGSANRQMAG